MVSLDFPEAGFGTVELSFSYADQPVLQEVDFHVMPGEVHALVGKQNEGKSTLCSILVGGVRPDSGWILAGGEPFRHMTPALSRSLGIEYVGKEANVFLDLTVAENIYIGDNDPWWRRFALWQSGFRRVRDWLDSYGIDLAYKSSIRKLRKEDRLFVELLSRLRRRPRLLILDETIEQLSGGRQADFKRVSDELMRDGMAIMWVTHKIEEALATSERITVLRRGRVLFSNRSANMDHVSLVRVCYSELGKDNNEDVTREQFYELIRFLEAMLRDMPAMVIIADLDGSMRLVNQSARSAFPEIHNWTGDSLDAFLRGLNAKLADDIASAISLRDEGEWHSVRIGSRAGDGILVDVKMRGIQERGVRIGHMVTIEDVSVRENMRQQLALSESLASVGLLAAGVAHEVNDPLAIINNYLGYIRGEILDVDIVRAIRLAQDEIGRIQQIIDNLVTFSGSDGVSDDLVDIMALAEELCTLIRFHTDARLVDFSCSCAGSRRLWIRANANEIRQVLLNLLRNALDAIDGDGTIALDGALEEEDGRECVRLTVSDSGRGIQLDNPEDIFRPFVTTKKHQKQHQGLGLSIVYSIMEKYGGRIQAANREEGGCRMRLTFPLASEEGKT